MARYLGLRGRSLSSLISLVCGLCFLCFGYAQGVLGGLLTVPAFLARFPQIDTINNLSSHNAKLQGITVGTWNLGCFASALLTIFLGDYLGRRKTLMLGLVLWSIGEIIQCSSYSFGQLIAGRFIAGFGNGFTTSTVPAYQAECVKSHRKGTILMISAGAFIAAGLALSYWLTFAFAYVSNASAAWRVPIAFQIIFAVIAFSLLLFLPESPRWLILTGREQEALRVLAALNDEPQDGPEIRDEFLQIKDAILIMSQGSTSSLRNNKERRNLHRVVLAYFVQVFQQVSGINVALQYFSIMFLKQLGYTGWVARLLGACASTEYFLASFITVVGIDRFWGRRSLMMFGAAGMSGCMVLMTVLTYLWQVHNMNAGSIAATVFLFGFATFFAIGWQGMAWLYQVEVVPLRIRGPANALSTSANWLFNFVIVFIAPIAFHNIGWRTYIIFAATNFAIIPAIYFLYPETAYRSLEEVDVLFHLASETPGNPWLNVVKISQNEPLWYGRKGDVPFDYARSEWHRHMERYAGSGTTLGRGSENEKNVSPSNGAMGIGQAMSSPDDGSPTGSNLSEKKLTQHKRNQASHPGPENQYSSTAPPAGILTRPILGHYDRNTSFHSQTSGKSGKSAHSLHSDPDWQNSELAPSPLHVPSVPSRASSINQNTYFASNRASSVHSATGKGADRPTTSDSARTAVSHYHPSETHVGPGLYHTASGRSTYYPSGHPEEIPDVPPIEQRRSSLTGQQSRSGSRPGSWGNGQVPREAGRGY